MEMLWKHKVFAELIARFHKFSTPEISRNYGI